MSAASVFRALADPTRREILSELGNGELAAGDIASRFSIAPPSVSRHLSILLGAGLIRQRREANRLYYAVEAETLAHALNSFLSAVCPTQIVRRKRRKA
jgi:DNA-binding transcriptional ArsR family regulator